MLNTTIKKIIRLQKKYNVFLKNILNRYVKKIHFKSGFHFETVNKYKQLLKLKLNVILVWLKINMLLLSLLGSVFSLSLI